MDHFGLSEDLAELRETVAAFARDKIAPVIGDFYARHEFPYEIVAQMGSMGLFGLAFPEEFGGMGGDYLAHCIAIEEIARIDSSVAITLEAAISLGAMPIFKFGTAEQKAQYLPDLIAGRKLAAFGLTEPGAGSDAGSSKTTARLSDDGQEWIINGSKAFITNSGTDITTLVTVTALTGPNEISTIIVPSGTPGFTVAPGYDKVGWCASDTHELSFDNVRVPVGNLLGERGNGFRQFLEILDEGRVAIAALATGLSQGCVDESALDFRKSVRLRDVVPADLNDDKQLSEAHTFGLAPELDGTGVTVIPYQLALVDVAIRSVAPRPGGRAERDRTALNASPSLLHRRKLLTPERSAGSLLTLANPRRPHRGPSPGRLQPRPTVRPGGPRSSVSARRPPADPWPVDLH